MEKTNYRGGQEAKETESCPGAAGVGGRRKQRRLGQGGVELGGEVRREDLGLWLARQLEDHGAWGLKVVRPLSLTPGA